MVKHSSNHTAGREWQAARHLLNRSGFGGRRDEIQAMSSFGLQERVERLFAFDVKPLRVPDWMSDYRDFSFRRFRRLSEEERRELRRKGRRHMRELQLGWLNHMIGSETPANMLWEKMTFFWHGHFATSVRKVKLPPLIFQQLSLFHQHAVGSFRELLHGITKDPAMLRYLDNNQNRRGKPNENFARELMELFSLGPGNYTETDVKEAARALTGWAGEGTEFRIRWRQHDGGKKAFLGHTGKFDGEDIVNVILEQPACAEFICRKILFFLGFESASPTSVATFAESFRESDYDIAALLKSIFLHPEFYQAGVMGNQIKTPLQLVVGTARTLDVEIDIPEFYLYALNSMGQVPYLPPNVKGWPGGDMWINTSRLLSRLAFGEIVARGEIPAEMNPAARNKRAKASQRNDKNRASRRFRGMRRESLGIDFEPGSLVERHGSHDELVKQVADVLISVELTSAERKTLIETFEAHRVHNSLDTALRMLVGDVMTLPAYQLC